MGCSLPGSSVHGISQAGILEWVAIPFSRGSSWSRDGTWVSRIAGVFFTTWASREAPSRGKGSKILIVLIDIVWMDSFLIQFRAPTVYREYVPNLRHHSHQIVCLFNKGEMVGTKIKGRILFVCFFVWIGHEVWKLATSCRMAWGLHISMVFIQFVDFIHLLPAVLFLVSRHGMVTDPIFPLPPHISPPTHIHFFTKQQNQNPFHWISVS